VSYPAPKEARGIRYRESGAANAPAIVLLHGVGSTSSAWKEQFGPLGGRYRVVAWTAPGYEKSALLPQPNPAAGDYADALAGLLDALGIEAAHLVTNSWGALVALSFSNRHAHRTRSLLLGAPTAGNHGMTPAQAAQRAEERIGRLRELGMIPMRKLDAEHLVARSAPQAARDWAGGGSGEFPTEAGYGQAIRMLYATDGVELIRGYPGPVLVVAGTEDAVTSPDTHAKPLAAAARHGRLEWVEGSGHLPQLEKPARFNALVSDFVDANC
jgi:pimeloyl-ACP methyl ester carboxylesterase